MFKIAERKPLHDNKYFKIIIEYGNYADVRSKNTGDTWRLRVEDGWIVTYHMPRGQKRYHLQCRSQSVASAVRKIHKHDDYVRHGRYGRSV